MLLVLLLVRVSFARTVSCFVLIKYYLSRTQVRMRRVSISSGFSKLWCVCFFLLKFRLQFVCLFVCFSSCVLKNVVRKKGRKEERHHHHPTTRSSTTHKKAAFFGEEKVVLLFFGRSRSLGLRLNARGRSTTFSGDLLMAGYAGYAPGHAVQELTEVRPVSFRRSFVVVVLCRNDASSIDRSIDRPLSSRVIGHRARAGVTTLQSRAARRTETRGRRSRRSHALNNTNNLLVVDSSSSSSFLSIETKSVARGGIGRGFGNAGKTLWKRGEKSVGKKYRRVKFETNAKIKAAFESGKMHLRDRVEMFFNTAWCGRRRREQRESGKTT